MASSASEAALPPELVAAHGRAALEQQRAEYNLLRFLLLVVLLEFRRNGEATTLPDAFRKFARNPWIDGLRWALTEIGERTSAVQEWLYPLGLDQATRLGNMRDWLLRDSLLEAEDDCRQNGHARAAQWVAQLGQCAGSFEVFGRHLADRVTWLLSGKPESEEHVGKLWSIYRDFTAKLNQLPDDLSVGYSTRTSMALAAVAEREDKLDVATSVYEKIARDASETDDPSRAIALYSLGRIARIQGNPMRAREYFEKAIVAFERNGNENGATHATLRVADAARAMGDQPLAQSLLERVIANSRDKRLSLDARVELADLLRQQRKFEKARVEFQEALTLAQASRADHQLGALYEGLADLEQEVQRWDTATELYHRALDANERHGDRSAVARVLLALGHVARERGDFLRAEEHYQRSIDLFAGVRSASGAQRAQQALTSLREQATVHSPRAGIRVTQRVTSLAVEEQEELLRRYPDWVSNQQATEVVRVLVQVTFGDDTDTLSEFFMEDRPPRTRARLAHLVVNESQPSALMAIALFPSGHTRTVGQVHMVDESEAELEPFDYWSLLDPDEAGNANQRVIDIDVLMVGVGVEL